MHGRMRACRTRGAWRPARGGALHAPRSSHGIHATANATLNSIVRFGSHGRTWCLPPRSMSVTGPTYHARKTPYSAPLLHLCAGTYKYTPLPFYGTQACPLALAQTCMQHSTDPLSSPAPSLQVVSSSSSRARKGRLASCGLRLDRRWVWLDLQLHVNVSA